MLAPKMTASTNGSGDAPSSLAIWIATGAPMTPVALLEMMLVRMAITSIRQLRIRGVGRPSTNWTSTWARYRAPSVSIIATPSARLATMIMMTVGESAPEASPQRRQRLPSMRPTPATEAASMGSTPVAAASITSAMMSSARGARWVRGRSVVPSSTSAVPARFRCANWSAVPCTSSTSPERNETEPISLTNSSSSGSRARCNASGSNPVRWANWMPSKLAR